MMLQKVQTWLACLKDSPTFSGKLTTKRNKKGLLEYGVGALFEANKTECLDPLLTALNEGTFLNKDLENIAIRKAFRIASFYQDDRTLLAKRFFDHPAISAKDYSDALYDSYQNGDQTKELFYWLLARADRQDLETIKSDKYFSTHELEYQQAVDHALKTVGTETRHETGRKRIIAVRVAATSEALEEHLPDDLRKLALEYVE